MRNIQQEVSSLKNLYLSYERVINNSFNTELVLDVERALFEKNLIDSLKKIQDRFNSDDELVNKTHKFSIVMKIKEIENNKSLKYRPLVIFKLEDHIYMQAIFNLVIEELKHFLPEENLGVVLNNNNNSFLYENWLKSYSKFVDRQKNNLSTHSTYQYAFEYDITQFFPSINQEKLIQDINDLLDDQWLKNKVKEVISFYSYEYLDEISKKNYSTYLNSLYNDQEQINCYKKDFGIPQGAVFSPFLAAFYTRELDSRIREKLNENLTVPIDIDYFSYVDDGRIYFHDSIEGSLVKNKVKEALDCISIGQKKLELSDKKTVFLELDSQGISAKLKVLEENISMTQKNIVQISDLDENDYDTLEKLHLNTIDMFNVLKTEANEYDSNEKNCNLNKVNKVNDTFIKRTASKASKKFTNGNHFYKYLEEFFNCDSRNEYCIDRINFEYVFKNMLNACDCPEKVYALFNKVNDLIKSLQEKFAKFDQGNLFNYYKALTMKYFFSLSYSNLGMSKNEAISLYVNLIKMINEEDILNDFIVLPLSDEWHEILNEILCSKNIKEDIKKCLLHINEFEDYIKVINLYKKLMPNIKLNFKEMETENNHPVFKMIIDKSIYEIYLIKSVSNDKIEDFSYFSIITYIKRIENKKVTNNMSEIELVNFLKILISFWKNRYHSYLLTPSLLNYEFMYMETMEDRNLNKLYLCEDFNSNYYSLKKNYTDKEYKEDFIEFFNYYFKCNNNYYIDDFGKSLPFWKFRILNYLNSVSFDIEYFYWMLENTLENYNEYCQSVDGSYLQITKLLEPIHLNSKYIDKIMSVHYFYTSVWKNGSPDLPFYTLHNQEHSIQLIENFMKLWAKMKGYFSLSKLEIYFLVVSCYLHDIGMLHEPEKNELYDMRNDKVANLFKEYEQKKSFGNGDIKSEGLLHSLYSINDKVKNLYGDIARNNHASKSKSDIEFKKSIPLNDNQERFIIGQISLNHYADSDDVYGKESSIVYDGQIVDIRRISIYLRLLDLTDIGKNRVSKDVLNWNSNRMGLISNFHWIKHLATDGISINSKLVENDISLDVKRRNNRTKFFNPKPNLEIEFIINYNYLPPSDNLAKSQSNYCKNFKDTNSNKMYKIVGNPCDRKSCNLRCKFLNTQYYFDNEIVSFNKYISTDEKVHLKLIHNLDSLCHRSDIDIIYKNLVTGEEITSATALIIKYFKQE